MSIIGTENGSFLVGQWVSPQFRVAILWNQMVALLALSVAQVGYRIPFHEFAMQPDIDYFRGGLVLTA